MTSWENNFTILILRNTAAQKCCLVIENYAHKFTIIIHCSTDQKSLLSVKPVISKLLPIALCAGNGRKGKGG